MVWQNAVVIAAVALAALFVLRAAWRIVAGRGHCGCGKASCGDAPAPTGGIRYRELVQLNGPAVEKRKRPT